MRDTLQKIERSLDRVEGWVERHDYKGFEPFDGLTSFLFPLTLRNQLACQVLQQGVRRFPVNIRPILGIKPLESTKGRGYMAWGYLKRYERSRDERYKVKALACLDWLDRNKSPLYPQHSWGNHFFYAARGGFIPVHTSTVVWTGLIGQVFLEAYALFGIDRHLEVIKSIADWIMVLPRTRMEKGICLNYTMPPQGTTIHNSNMIGAAFLAGASELFKNDEWSRVAREAMDYSCAGQLPDGSWYYGEDPMFHWIDAFHTGYNLDSLRRYRAFSRDTAFDQNLEKGHEFFVNHFFEASGQVKYYSEKTRPIDIQCASQAIDTLVLFSDTYPGDLALAEKAAAWTVDHMQGRDGHFYFRKYPLGIANKAPMIHWGQATMHKALSFLLRSLPAG
jgi:hypothetical protein